MIAIHVTAIHRPMPHQQHKDSLLLSDAHQPPSSSQAPVHSLCLYGPPRGIMGYRTTLCLIQAPVLVLPPASHHHGCSSSMSWASSSHGSLFKQRWCHKEIREVSSALSIIWAFWNHSLMVSSSESPNALPLNGHNRLGLVSVPYKGDPESHPNPSLCIGQQYSPLKGLTWVVLHPQIPPFCSAELFPLLYTACYPHTLTRMKLLPFPPTWLSPPHRMRASDISLGVQPQCSCFPPRPGQKYKACWGKGLVQKQTYSSSLTCLAKLRPRLAVC